MIHAHTRALLEEWRRQRGGDRLPARTRMAAAAFGPLLPQVFVLGRVAGVWRFRLAGGRLVDLHGRELRGEAFGALWSPASRAGALHALERAVAHAEPVVLRARGEAAAAEPPSGVWGDPADAHSRWLELEVALAPLTGPTEGPDRIIGLHQPTSLLARLQGAATPTLRLLGVAEATPAPSPALRLVVDNTRQVA